MQWIGSITCLFKWYEFLFEYSSRTNLIHMCMHFRILTNIYHAPCILHTEDELHPLLDKNLMKSSCHWCLMFNVLINDYLFYPCFVVRYAVCWSFPIPSAIQMYKIDGQWTHNKCKSKLSIVHIKAYVQCVRCTYNIQLSTHHSIRFEANKLDQDLPYNFQLKSIIECILLLLWIFGRPDTVLWGFKRWLVTRHM